MESCWEYWFNEHIPFLSHFNSLVTQRKRAGLKPGGRSIEMSSS